MQMGEILRAQSLVSEADLSRALALQARYGSRLGDILVSEGVIGHYALYQALAEHCGLAFVNLLNEPPDASLIDRSRAETYLKRRAIPWRKSEDGVITVALAEMCDATKPGRGKLSASARPSSPPRRSISAVPSSISAAICSKRKVAFRSGMNAPNPRRASPCRRARRRFFTGYSRWRSPPPSPLRSIPRLPFLPSAIWHTPSP